MQQIQVEDLQVHSIKPKAPIHWTSVWQLGFSLMGILSLGVFALTLVGIVVSSAIDGTGGMGDALPLLLMAAGIGFSGLLLLPSAGHAFLRLVHKPSPFRFSLPRPGLLILVVPLLLGLGFLTAQNATLIWITLPPIHVITIGISVLWLITLGTRGLYQGSRQRQWGIFGAGLVIAPMLSLLAELVIIVVVGILGIGYLARDPVFAAELTQLSERYLINPNLPMDTVLEVLEPYLMQPITIYAGLVLVAILVPLVEEFFKPVGVWLLVGRNPSPTQGFAAGVLSGAGFALFENFTLSASSGEEWSLVVTARLGTSIIHIVTTGLTGWALASAWQKNRYLQLGLTYLTSVAIHALWNGLVVLSIVPELMPDLGNYPDTLYNIGAAAPIGFMVLLAGSFILLLGCNRTLRRAIIPPVKTVPPTEAMPTSLPGASFENLNTSDEILPKISVPQPPNTLFVEGIEEENPKNGNHQLTD
jgi:hypothetical protein